MLFRENEVVTPEAGGKRGVSLGRVEGDGSIRLLESVRLGDGVGVYSKRGVHGDVVRRIEVFRRAVDAASKDSFARLFLNAKPGDEVALTSGAARRKPVRIQPKEKIVLSREEKKSEPSETAPQALPEQLLLVKVYSQKDAFSALEAGALRVFYDVFAEDFPRGDPKVGPYVPRCLSDWKAEEALRVLEELGGRSVLCGDPGVAACAGGGEVFLDVSGNVFNDLDVSFYNGFGVIPVVSPELSIKELSSFRDKRFAVYAHGRVPLMTTKYRLAADSLRDELGYVFPIRAESDYRQVKNSVPLALFSEVRGLTRSGVKCFLLDLEEDVAETVGIYGRILGGGEVRRPRGYTLGNYRKGVL
jgi:hypothetical protein